jgi:tocopherol O-methyltransferase
MQQREGSPPAIRPSSISVINATLCVLNASAAYRQKPATMTRYNDTKDVSAFYDFASHYFRTLWGEHFHHGYWIRGDESRETAQDQLVDHLATFAEIKPGAQILDVGCGMGASSVYLAKHYEAIPTGITISPIQVQMANELAEREKVKAKFLLMDAQEITLDESFDVVWSIESISHYQRKGDFFASAAPLLKSGGVMAITDWFKKENLDRATNDKFIRPIEKGMLSELATMQDYEKWIEANGLKVTHAEVMNEHCAKSWDTGIEVLKDKELWRVAMQQGVKFVRFLSAIRAMRNGFSSGNFVYGLMVAKKSG